VCLWKPSNPGSKKLQQNRNITTYIPRKDNDADNAEDNLKTNKRNFNGIENDVDS